MTKNDTPVFLWIAIIFMGIFAGVHLISSFSHPIQFFAFVVNSILLIGLYYGKKWSYILTIIFSLIIPLILLLLDSGTAFLILILNSIVVIPLLLSTRYFYPILKEEKQH